MVSVKFTCPNKENMAIRKMPTEKIIATYFITKAIKITIMLCQN